MTITQEITEARRTPHGYQRSRVRSAFHMTVCGVCGLRYNHPVHAAQAPVTPTRDCCCCGMRDHQRAARAEDGSVYFYCTFCDGSQVCCRN